MNPNLIEVIEEYFKNVRANDRSMDKFFSNQLSRALIHVRGTVRVGQCGVYDVVRDRRALATALKRNLDVPAVYLLGNYQYVLETGSRIRSFIATDFGEAWD